MFDSSVVRGRPSEMQLKNMLPGLAEGIELMQVGETRRLWIPREAGLQGKGRQAEGHAGIRRDVVGDSHARASRCQSASG